MAYRKKRLSLKEKGFAQDFVFGKDPGNGTQAAMENYNVKTRKSASVIATKVLQRPEVQTEIETIMENHKITDPFLMKRLKEGLNAKVVTKYESEATETDIADQNIRHKFWQDAAKMKGWLKDRLDVRSFNIDIELESLSKEEFADLLKSVLVSLKNVKPIQNTTSLQRGQKKVAGGVEAGG